MNLGLLASFAVGLVLYQNTDEKTSNLGALPLAHNRRTTDKPQTSLKGQS